MECMELMQRVHAGDDEAFKALYARYSQVVYRVAFSKLQDQEAALGVVKAVFRTAYDTLRERGPIESDFYGWLDAQTARELRHREARGQRKEIPAAPPPVFPERPQTPPTAPRRVERVPAAPVAPSAPAAPQPAAYAPAAPVTPAAPAAPAAPRVRHYSEREAEAIEARALSRLNQALPEEEPEEAERKPVFAILGGVVACGLLLWLLGGLLMRLGVLPFMDLGYVWFDTTFFPLFR